MPPKPRTPEEKQRDKQRIIDAALSIVQKQGLDGLSIRKLSGMLNMSATNIYNYFYNKDEIYLHILITGFDLVHKAHEKALIGVDDPLEQLEISLSTFVRLAEQHPAYYQLMFSTQDPKYTDYVGTPIEKMAAEQKARAMMAFNYLEDIVSKCIPNLSPAELRVNTARIFSEIHGYVNIQHNHVLREMDCDSQLLLDNLVEHIMAPIRELHE